MKNKLSLLSVCLLMQGITFAQAPYVSDQTTQIYIAGKTIVPLLVRNTGEVIPYGMVSSFAGNNSSQDGLGVEAKFSRPRGLAGDAHGNLYVADYRNNRIMKISPAGKWTTLAGSGEEGSADGIGIEASFYVPSDVAVDALGNIYVADRGNNTIRKISPPGMVTTLAGSGFGGSADGIGTSASFYEPTGIVVDAQGNIYVADTYNNKIRKISPTGKVSTLAGSGSSGSVDGIGIAASFDLPSDIALDAQGNIYVADMYNNKIRKIETKSYMISPELPAGLNIDSATGTISGTPKVASPEITYTITYGIEISTVSIMVN